MPYPGSKPSVDWIDVSKGLGIYLVVLGHANIEPKLQQFIYLFHMPLFFFLSGYLHTVKTEFGRFLRKKVIHLLLPYASFMLLLYPLEFVRILLHHKAGHPLGHAILAALWGGSRLQGTYGVFWFLPCLFLTQQLMNFILASFRLRTVIGLVSAALLLSYANTEFIPWFNLPLDANVVFAAMPFFLLGLLAARFALDRLLIVAVSASGAAIAAYLTHVSVPIFYDMRDGIYGLPGVSLILAICCIGCVIIISKAVATVSPIRKVFAGLGASSMGIMFIHKALPVIPHLNTRALRHGYLAADVFVAISFCVTWMLGRTTLTRAILIGSERDFYNLFGSSRLAQKEEPLTDETDSRNLEHMNEMA
jgi:polysaccharide biosynthesis protein PslL